MPESTSLAEPISFEDSLTELQRIVADLEEGRVGLEESLAQFERGISLLKTCHQTLQRAEQRIELLVGVKSDGTPITKQFEASATMGSEAELPTAGRRKPRKTKVDAPPLEPVNPPDDSDDPGFLF